MNSHPGRQDETSQTHRRHRVWTVIRILNVRLRFILLMVLTGLVAAKWDSLTAHWDRWTRAKEISTATEAARQYEYYCPMHPSVVRAEPGNCPICGMPLVKREREEKPGLPEGVLARVELSPYRMQLAGIATTEVGLQPLHREVRAVGTIEVDETRVAEVASRVPGRIERLWADFTGRKVEQGEPLVELYSPELVSTQEEYLLALHAYQSVKDGPDSQVIKSAAALVGAARERLHLWGIADAEIARLEREGQASPRMTIRAPLSGIVTSKQVVPGQYVMEGSSLYSVTDLSRVWMTAYVYEEDIPAVRVGQRVEVSADAFPGKVFSGTVSFIWPLLDVSTRTLRLRVAIPNPDLALRPGMYVEARIEAGGAGPAGPAHEMAGEMAGEMAPGMVMEMPPAGAVLAVPESAILDTGTRQVVYVEREEGIFEAVEVTLGSRSGGYYPVEKGLAAGDRVVTQGAFLVDAEVRLNPAAAGSYFGASGGPAMGKTAAAGGPPAHAGHAH